MAFEYIQTAEAIERQGLRMVVVGNVPSPWGEAAKGVFHVKGLDWSAVRLDHEDTALAKWAGQLSGPVAIYNDEPPKSGWTDILFLAERLAPAPPLLPTSTEDRILMFGLAHELFGQNGLGWSRRLQMIAATFEGHGGWTKPVARYLGDKYGYSDEVGNTAKARMLDLLSFFAARLKNQQAAGSAYYVGDSMTAVDIYSAACMALFDPLPEAQCAMKETTRATFSYLDTETAKALDPVLLAHRDMMYETHLELPMVL